MLVVDDDPVTLKFVTAALEQMGFAVETYADLQKAATPCEDLQYDILLVDKNLPDGSGLELCQRVAAVRKDCKVVLMSGAATMSSAVEAFRYGVADYMVKPFEVEDMRVRFARVCGLIKLERRNRRLLRELERRNEELAGLAVRDPLTRLFNHAYLQEMLHKEVRRSARQQRPVSLALIDIDAFSEVNEALGHETGDRVMRTIGAMLRGTTDTLMTAAVGDEGVVARFGGDVFALLLPETPRAEAAARLEELRGAMSASSFGISGLPLQTFSVGIATFPEDARDSEGLVRAVELALEAAKDSGGDKLMSYTRELDTAPRAAAAAQAERTRSLGKAIANRAFHFHYQPIVRASDYGMFAYEALCRPTGGLFKSVPELLRAASDAGRVWDLSRALRQVAAAPIRDLPPNALMFINLHPHDLNDEQLINGESFLVPWAERIVFEVTETEHLGDLDRARALLEQLREMGFKVALDDLGSGYSGLNCLASLAPDFVKLDMELIRGIERDNRRARLVRHFLEFCAGEGLAVIAEGIETAAELYTVVELGVPLVQGYALARPQEPFCDLKTLPPPEVFSAGSNG